MTSKTNHEPTFKLVEGAFSAAILMVDKQFGDGYSLKNPHLVAELSRTILDVNSSTQNLSNTADQLATK
jgi:hypothetical protein